MSRMKEILLNRPQERDSEPVGGDGKGDAATFDGKRLRQKGKFRNGERML